MIPNQLKYLFILQKGNQINHIVSYYQVVKPVLCQLHCLIRIDSPELKIHSCNKSLQSSNIRTISGVNYKINIYLTLNDFINRYYLKHTNLHEYQNEKLT